VTAPAPHPHNWVDGTTAITAVKLNEDEGDIAGVITAHNTLANQVGGLSLPEASPVALTAAVATPANLLGVTTRFDTTAAAITQTLPVATAGAILACGWDAGTNALTLIAAGTDVIGAGAGVASLTVSLPGEWGVLHCTTAGRWRHTARSKPTSARDTQSVVRGRYSRSQPLPDGPGSSIRPLVMSPTTPGRMWAVGSKFGQIGFSDDHGATFTAKTVAGSQAVQSMVFGASYVWVLTSQGTAKTGQLYRSPLPDASGNGLSFTLVFDLAAPPGTLTTGDTAGFRNSCVAVNGTNVYLVEYSSATVTGGPSLYYSADSGATWSKPYTWTTGKHCHAVKVIAGVPWVTIGDGGFTGVGLWTATAANALAWNQRSQYGEATGGNTNYGINMVQMPVGGQPMVVMETDGKRGLGPIVFPSVDPTMTAALLPLHSLPAPYVGTMRSLTYTAEGNLMWFHTGEGGSVGPQDSVCISQGPLYTSAVVLESIPAGPQTFSTTGDPVEDGQYVWFGTYRCAKELFL